MAHALGLVASTISILDFTTKVTTTLSSGYIDRVSHSSNSPATLVEEMKSLTCVLSALEEFAKKHPGSRLNNGQHGPLQECFRDLKELDSKLAPRSGSKWVVGYLKQPLREKETLSFIDRIEKHKSHLTIALNEDKMSAMQSIKMHARLTGNIIQCIQTETLGVCRESEGICTNLQELHEAFN